MKKFLISMFVIMCGLCAYAANWTKISEKIYLDTSDISSGYKEGIVSFWTKELNDGGDDFYLAERKHSQKIWYDLVRYSLDCKARKFKIEEVLIYGLQNNLIATDASALETWHSIPPQSLAEDYMKLVCKYQPEPEKGKQPTTTTDPKANSTPPKGGLTFTEVTPPNAPLIRMEVIKPKK